MQLNPIFVPNHYAIQEIYSTNLPFENKHLQVSYIYQHDSTNTFGLIKNRDFSTIFISQTRGPRSTHVLHNTTKHMEI